MEPDLFRGVVPFVAVAEEGGIRRAAVRLGVSPAAISKAVRQLEQEVGLALISREGRSAQLTREGRAFFERCRPAVSAVQGARAALEALKSEPAGELTLSVPMVLARPTAPVLASLRARHPGLRFRLSVSDAISRLAEESVDVAVRIGALEDSSLIARRLRRTELWTVASPAYLARRGRPATIAALEGHDAMGLIGPKGKPWPWWFKSGPAPQASILLTDHGPSLVEAALAGLGVTQAFDFMLRPLVEEGRLIRLLEGETAEGPEIYAICSPGRRANPRVQAAFEAFAQAFERSARELG